MYSELNQSTLKYKKLPFEERLQNMVDKLESFRQSDFFTKRSNIFQIESQKTSGRQTKSSTRLPGLRKSQIIQRPSNGSEIEEFLTIFQKNSERASKQKNLLTPKETKMIKSQFICIPEEEEADFEYERKMRNQKSESEMKYLEICNTSKEYVQEFLNVLEGYSEHNPESSYLENASKTKKTAPSSESSQKHLQMIQEQQEQISPVKEKSWKQRCREAITKSRRIMDKTKYSTKFSSYQRNQ